MKAEGKKSSLPKPRLAVTETYRGSTQGEQDLVGDRHAGQSGDP